MYFAVFYATDGTIHLWPNEEKEKCEEKLFNMLKDPYIYDRCKRTTIIKREGEDYIFGCPNSLNIKEKFDKALKKGKVKFND